MTKIKSSCPICEASGSSGPCKGHGGGGSDDSNESSSSSKKLDYADVSSTSDILLYLVMQHHSDLNSNSDIARTGQLPSVMSIKIDPVNHALSFSRNTSSLETFKALAQLIQKAMDELMQLNSDKREQLSGISLITNDEKIIIHTPSMKLFNLVVKHLMQLNLLPSIEIPSQDDKSLTQVPDNPSNVAQVTEQSRTDDECSEKSTTQNPFSM